MFTVTELALFWDKRKYAIIVFFLIVLFVYIAWRTYSWYYGRELYRANSPRALHMYPETPVSIARNIFIPESKFRKPLVPNGFCFCFFLKINDWYANYGFWKHVFHRGSVPNKIVSGIDEYGNSTFCPGQNMSGNDKNKGTPEWTLVEHQNPGIWLADRQNTLRLCITTRKDVFMIHQDGTCKKNQENAVNGKLQKEEIEFIDVDNVLVGKFFHIAILSVGNNTVLVFLNGQLKKTLALAGSPIESHEHVYMGAGRSFPGSIVSFRYVPEVLTSNEIMAIYKKDRKKISAVN